MHVCIAAHPALRSGGARIARFTSWQGLRSNSNGRNGRSGHDSHGDITPVPARWFKAVDYPESKPSSPDWKPSKQPSQWQSFSQHDSDRIERALCTGQQSVTVGVDGLLEVDVPNRIVQPTYWSGPSFKVVRGTWFYASGARPLPEQLAWAVEKAFQQHLLSSTHSALKAKGAETEPAQQRFELPHTTPGKFTVAFGQHSSNKDPQTTTKEPPRVYATLYDQSWLATVIQHLGGTKIVRGFFPPPAQVAGPEEPIDSETLARKALATTAAPDREVKNLVLCIHGVGQQLGARFESVDFVKDVNRFRDELQRVYDNSTKLQKARQQEHAKDYRRNHGIQVLPIQWRRAFDFNGEDSHAAPRLRNVKPEEMFPGDNILAQVVMDFLMYTQPDLRHRMANAAVKCLNQQYALFCEHNKAFAANPNVSIVAHSLGAVVIYDILRWHCNQLDFEVDKLFMLGSPVGMVELLHGRSLDSGDLAVNSLYNVMRTSDPVATRLEPLAAMNAAKVPPKMIPGAGATIISQVRSIADELSQLSTSISAGTATLLRAISAQPHAPGAAITQATETAQSVPGPLQAALPNPKLVEQIEKTMAAFNRHNRLDFALPENIDVSLIIGLAGHLTYFESPEVSRFVLYELLQAGEAEDAARDTTQ